MARDWLEAYFKGNNRHPPSSRVTLLPAIYLQTFPVGKVELLVQFMSGRQSRGECLQKNGWFSSLSRVLFLVVAHMENMRRSRVFYLR